MNDVLRRVRSADPVPGELPAPSESTVAAIVAAAKEASAGTEQRPRTPGRRAVLLAVAAGVGIAAVPVALTLRSDRVDAAPLRELAKRLSSPAAPPPPGRAVLYARWRSKSISATQLSESPADFIRSREEGVEESWLPQWPSDEAPVSSSTTTIRYFTRADARRAASLGLPPEGEQTYEHTACGRTTCSTLPKDQPDAPGRMRNPTPAFVQDLPSDPTALGSLILADPEIDRDASAYQAAVVGLVEYEPVPRRVRAALIVLLAELPGIRVYGEQTVEGRRGISYGMDGQDPRDATVLDLETGLVLRQQLTLGEWARDEPLYAGLPLGTVIQSRTLTDVGYVAKLRQRP